MCIIVARTLINACGRNIVDQPSSSSRFPLTTASKWSKNCQIVKRVGADHASRPRCVSNEMNRPGGITRAILCPVEITFYLRPPIRFHLPFSLSLSLSLRLEEWPYLPVNYFNHSKTTIHIIFNNSIYKKVKKLLSHFFPNIKANLSTRTFFLCDER